MRKITIGFRSIIILFLLTLWGCSNEEQIIEDIENTTLEDEIIIEEEEYPESVLDSILEKELEYIEKGIKFETKAKVVPKNNPKKVYVHYMPWFESKDFDGEWGTHWTMNNRNPDNKLGNRREIASHYYPLIGPYSSNDPSLHEYHLLLMKMAGIDGVIFDWYGSRDVNDYLKIKNSTESFITKIEEVGMKFSIMYEDRVVEFNEDIEGENVAVQIVQNDFKYIEDNYFTSPNYHTVAGKKSLFIFGPEYVKTPEDWTQVFSIFKEKPSMLTLWGATDRVGGLGSGEFSWVDKGHLLAQAAYYDHVVDNCKTSRIALDIAVGAVYPGFNTYYEEGGWGDQVDNLNWEIPHTNSFEQTLRFMDERSCVDFVQLITWNDFGEGTMIEPTKEFKYKYIDQLKAYTEVSTRRRQLRLPKKLYDMRKRYKHYPIVQLLLNRIYQFMFGLEYTKAEMLMEAVKKNYTTI